jgi:RNA polymerase sigma-70 factor (ECF subfamily)
VNPPGLDELLVRAREGDPQSLRALVDVYASRVFGLLFRLTGARDVAEELTQETFLRLVRTIAEYEHSGKFESWLFRIAANLARDRGRQYRRRGAAVPLDVPPGPGGPAAIERPDDAASDPAALLAESEERERLGRCLDSLPELDREILLLRHFSGLSFREIAALLSVPIGTALARAHRAIGRLREEFGVPTPIQDELKR